MYRVGIDTGGTHTDTVLLNELTGETWVDKVPSTPADPAEGVIDGLQRLIETNGVKPDEISMIVYGTTVMVNSIIQGQSTNTALITTAGFRDVLELRRSFRTGSIYDIQWDQPATIIPRNLRYEVDERIDYTGRVLTPLNETQLEGILNEIRKNKIESVAVCLLHSYMNAEHELRIEEFIASRAPELYLSVSSRISPAIGEYERTSTVAIDAMVKPGLSSHLKHLESRIREIGIFCPLNVMQANGGTMSFDAASREPVRVINSGPVAGVMAANLILEKHDVDRALSLDMGGTSTDFAIILEDGPIEQLQGAIQGHPIQQSVVEVDPIGAGGGSIGWVDDGGALRVGPMSAGAFPGPVCYGRGGTKPTITDAALVLGYITADSFLGGRSTLDIDAARGAIRAEIAEPLGFSLEQAAFGIIQISVANCLRAARRITVQRGHDPRELGMITFGGAGGLIAGFLGRELGVHSIIIPRDPGNTSALGLLITDERHDKLKANRGLLNSFDSQHVENHFQALAADLREELAAEHVDPTVVEYQRTLELRYFGQTYELGIAAREPFDLDERERVQADFHAAHEQRYGHSAPEDPVELVNMKLHAIVKAPEVSEWSLQSDGETETSAVIGRHNAYFGEWHEATFYNRDKLQPGAEISGPAVIQEQLSTTIVLPRQNVQITDTGDIVITG